MGGTPLGYKRDNKAGVKEHPLELKVPPLVVFILSWVMIWACARWLPFWPFPRPPRWLPVVLWGVGLSLAGSAILEFRKAQTTIHPTDPTATSHLVTTGVYTYTRNPMYLSLALLLLGLCLHYACFWGLIYVICFVMYLNRFQVIPEERILKEKFGHSYELYCKNVRRWL